MSEKASSAGQIFSPKYLQMILVNLSDKDIDDLINTGKKIMGARRRKRTIESRMIRDLNDAKVSLQKAKKFSSLEDCKVSVINYFDAYNKSTNSSVDLTIPKYLNSFSWISQPRKAQKKSVINFYRQDFSTRTTYAEFYCVIDGMHVYRLLQAAVDKPVGWIGHNYYSSPIGPLKWKKLVSFDTPISA